MTTKMLAPKRLNLHLKFPIWVLQDGHFAPTKADICTRNASFCTWLEAKFRLTDFPLVSQNPDFESHPLRLSFCGPAVILSVRLFLASVDTLG